MPLTERVIDSVNVRFMKKGKKGHSNFFPAKIVVTDTGKIDVFFLEDKIPPIHLKAANIKKPERSEVKKSIPLHFIRNVTEFHYVHIGVRNLQKSGWDELYDTLMIAWTPKKSGYFNNDVSLVDVVPVQVPLPNENKVVEPSARGDTSTQVDLFNNHYAKRPFDESGTIVLDDADEPPAKKKAEEEPAPSAEVVELRQKLKQSEEKFQKLCDVARRDKEALQARVDFLETLVDSKEGIVKNANKSSVEDELKKKLEEERKRSAKLKQNNELIKGQLLQLSQQLQQSISTVLESSEV